MKIYQCDFCKTEIPCTQTVIDNRSYDICYPCKDKRDAQLKDRGEQVLNTWSWPYIYTVTTPKPTEPFSGGITTTTNTTLCAKDSSDWNTDFILDNN